MMDKKTVFDVLEWLGNGRVRDESWYDASVLFGIAWHYAPTLEDRNRVDTAKEDADNKYFKKKMIVDKRMNQDHYEFFKAEMLKKDIYYQAQIEILKKMLDTQSPKDELKLGID